MPRPTSTSPARTGEVSLPAPAAAPDALVGAPSSRRSRRRLAAFVGALTGTLTLGLGPLGATAPAHAADLDTDPLVLTLEQMTPAVVQADSKRPVVLRGTVKNVSDETWTGVNVAPFRSASPITDRAELAEAAATPDDEVVGDRLTAVSSLTTIDSLGPGETAPFTATIPRSALSSAPGVYWVGVHARGRTESQPRDEITDGRARTFLPVQASDSRALRSALVLPLRTSVRYEADGRLADASSWLASLREGGELHDLLLAGQSALGTRTSWLVDAAVLHAVGRLADGNPGWELSASGEKVPHATETPSSTTGTEPAAEGGSDAEDDPTSTARVARRWLDEFVAVLTADGSDVHALPYGDIDVSAVSRQSPHSLVPAQQRALEVLEAFGVEATPAVSPVDGTLSPGTLANLLPKTLVLLEDDALSTDAAAPVPGAGTVEGMPFVTTSGGTSEGGPGPESPGTAVAVRQRALSEATLRGLGGNRSTLVLLPPSGWDADAGTAEFVRLFDTGGLRDVSLSSAASPTATGEVTLAASALNFGPTQRAALLPRSNVRVAKGLQDNGVLLEDMLTHPAGMDVQASDVARTSLSYAARSNPSARREVTQRSRQELRALIDEVEVKGPSVVTLSGSSGRMGATVSNGLPVPVTVRVGAVASDTIEISGPEDVAIAPRSRARLLLEAERVQQGVTTVSLEVSTRDGLATGARDTFQVRSLQVSGFLWLVIGGGAAVLFGAIAFRFFRRGLASRREQGVV